MQWTDIGCVLAAKKFGEQGLILECFTREHGKASGLVRGVKKNIPLCQSGNFLQVTWKARLEEQLGNFTIEMEESITSELMLKREALLMMNSALSMLRLYMADREEHPALYDYLTALKDAIKQNKPYRALYCCFELELLRQLGFGLTLEVCADTGSRDHLTHVSPNSGMAVCEASAQPYLTKLLKLPAFLKDASRISPAGLSSTISEVKASEIIDACRLTGYFLEKWIVEAYHARLPDARDSWLSHIKQHAYEIA